MKLRNDASRYGAFAQSLHWLIAALVLAMFGIGWYMDSLPLGPDKVKTFNLHKSLGLTILALMLLRLAWRVVSPPPPLPAATPGPERLAARLNHLLLYMLLMAQPIIGFLHSNAANFPVVVWGVLTLPPLIGPNETLKDELAGLHWYVAWALLALIAVHVVAALRHHLLLKDDVLRRMLPGHGA